MNQQGNPIRSKLRMFRESGSRTDRCDVTNSTFSSSMVQHTVGDCRSKSALKQLLRDKENAIRDETAQLYRCEL